MMDMEFKELELNIKYQNINVDEFTTVGYEFEKDKYVFMLMLPKEILK